MRWTRCNTDRIQKATGNHADGCADNLDRGVVEARMARRRQVLQILNCQGAGGQEKRDRDPMPRIGEREHEAGQRISQSAVEID